MGSPAGLVDYVGHATRCLTQAKGIVGGALDAEEAVAGQLALTDATLAKLEFAHTATKDLVALVNTYETRARDEANGWQLARAEMAQRGASVLDRLTRVKRALEGVTVEPGLELIARATGASSPPQNAESCSERLTLYEFINDVELEDVRRQLQDSLHQLEISDPTHKEPWADKLKQEWKALDTQYVQARDDFYGVIEPLMAQNSNLELETVDLLRGLNLHWDKCQDKNPSRELLDVIKEDHQTLPDVMAMLEANCSQMSANCDKIASIVSALDTLKESMRAFVNKVQDFAQVSKETKNAETDISVLHKRFDLACAGAEGLVEDCVLFLDAYHELLMELDRRAAAQDRMARLVAQFETEARNLAQEDGSLRTAFLAQHADFLPLDLAPLKLVEAVPALPSVQYQRQQVPSVSAAGLAGVARQLELLKDFM